MRTGWAPVSFALVSLACESGETLTLGASPPEAPGSGAETKLPLVFDQVAIVAALSNEAKDDNPTLTADLQLLCFTSTRVGGTGDVDIWCSARTHVDEDFGEPIEIADLNTSGFETSAALSLDGLDLWFASQREGGLGELDIWKATRASREDVWGAPELVPELNSIEDDIPRPPARDNTLMPLASRRNDGLYRTYFAERAGPDASFSPPNAVIDLSPDGRGFVDAQMSEDGLLLIFTMAPTNTDASDLFASVRATTSDPFEPAVAIDGVNTGSDDRDPWLSPDGETLYFSSDRSGDFEIYRATRVHR